MFLIFAFPLLSLTHSSCCNEQFLTAVLKLLQEKKHEKKQNTLQQVWDNGHKSFFLLTKPEIREMLFQALSKLREFCTFIFFTLDSRETRAKFQKENTQFLCLQRHCQYFLSESFEINLGQGLREEVRICTLHVFMRSCTHGK